MPIHRDLTGSQVHVPHAWAYADETARTAATDFVGSDVGKLALQADTGVLYRLDDHDPVTWVAAAPIASQAEAEAGASNDVYMTALRVAQALAVGGAPAGVVNSFAGGSVPSGWLECDGAAVSRSTYSSLFAVIGTTYGAGDGSTTFNVPDLRGEFVRGWDHGRGADSGRSLGATQEDATAPNGLGLKRATQPSSGSGVYQGTEVGDVALDGAVGAQQWTEDAFSDWGNYYKFTGDSETRPRNVALIYIIKT